MTSSEGRTSAEIRGQRIADHRTALPSPPLLEGLLRTTKDPAGVPEHTFDMQAGHERQGSAVRDSDESAVSRHHLLDQHASPQPRRNAIVPE